jgi:aminoglycoside/choline kinase family phosphotransferase
MISGVRTEAMIKHHPLKVREIFPEESQLSSHVEPPADLLDWALAALERPSGQGVLLPVSGDASNRRYFRLQVEGESYVVAHAPPATEKNVEFVAMQQLLSGAGIPVPALHAVDLPRGYLLQQDLGATDMLSLLHAGSADKLYEQATAVLLQLAQLPVTQQELPQYDRALLTEELSRFSQWFVGELLTYRMSADEQVIVDDMADWLIDSALAQPRVLVHRDFHSRNLMWVDAQPVVIDFQDAVVGPVTYDLVSLLRDCYVRWPAQRVNDWAGAYHALLRERGVLPQLSAEEFMRAFDLMGLQRHLKVLGTFARLYLRDGKARYLEDLPRVLQYVDEIAQRYREEPACAAFHAWMQARLQPLIAAQQWGQAL